MQVPMGVSGVHAGGRSARLGVGEEAGQSPWRAERRPRPGGLGEAVGHDDHDCRVVPEPDVAAEHLDALPPQAPPLDARPPGHHPVGPGEDGGRGDTTGPAVVAADVAPDLAAAVGAARGVVERHVGAGEPLERAERAAEG